MDGAGGGAGDGGGAGGGFSGGCGEFGGAIEAGAEGRVVPTWGICGASGYYRFVVDDVAISGGYAGHYYLFALGGCHSAGDDLWRGTDGGKGGKGGVITVSTKANINAYNGKFKKTESEDTKNVTRSTESVIYAQLGYSLDEMNKDRISYTSTNELYSRFNNGVLSIARISDTLDYANNPSGMISYLSGINASYRSISYDVYTKYGNMGIGSGAGFHEYDNGTFTVDESLN